MTFDGDNEYQPVDFGHPFSDTRMEFTLETMGASQNQSPILVQISSKFPVSLQCLGVWHFHFHCYGHLLMCFVFCFALRWIRFCHATPNLSLSRWKKSEGSCFKITCYFFLIFLIFAIPWHFIISDGFQLSGLRRSVDNGRWYQSQLGQFILV